MTVQTHQEKIEKLRELIKDIDFAMLTTVDEDGSLHSRPMSTQEAEFNGDLWFFTSADTGLAHEVVKNDNVNVSYASGAEKHVSVSGRAILLNDRAKMKEFWSPIYKAYFPDGLDDPNLRLLKVSVQKAEYWESSGFIATAIAFVQSLAGKETEMGENEKLTLKN